MHRARMKTIGPKEANSLPLSGAFASATVPKILVLEKYPLPVNSVSQALEKLVILAMYRIIRNTPNAVASPPRTINQGLSLYPVVMNVVNVTNTATKISG